MQAREAVALQLQAPWVLPVVCRSAHGTDGRAPRRARDPLGADTPMGRLGADPVAVWDGRIPGPHRYGPYDHPHHDRSV